MSKKISKQGKHWCFTINNPTEVDIIEDKEPFTYLVMGKEIGSNGTPHWQCYAVFKKRLRRSQVVRHIPRAHLEPMYSTPEAAANYCKKEGDFMEYGTLPLTAGQNTKEHWKKARQLALENKIDEIEDDHIYVTSYNSLKRIAKDHPVIPPDLDDTCGIWIWGPAGAGKSRYARMHYAPFYDKPLNKWWDGYRSQANILVDDLDDTRSVFVGYYLKRWADQYSFPAENKGGTVQLRPDTIVVTSQFNIEELYQGNIGDAIARRFTRLHMPNVYKKPPRIFMQRTPEVDKKSPPIIPSDAELSDSDSDFDLSFPL